MTQQPTNQPPYTGAPGPGGYPQQDQIPGQNPYGQQPQYGAQNPYGQGRPQNPYGTPGGPGGYGPPPKKKSNKLLITRLVVLVGVLGLAAGGWAYNNAHKAKRGADGAVSTTGDLNAFSIKVNDCYEKPKDALTGFDSVKAVPCEQPHTAQVYFSFLYPNATSVAPTDDALKAVVDPQCTDAAKTKVDEAKVPQDALMNYLIPDDNAWKKGHHDILCVVENETDFSGTVVKG
ncbi:MAG: septum formation family protein [Catenulispora sp.]